MRVVRRPARSHIHPLNVLSIEVEEKVRAVIQVAGINNLVRPDPTDDDKIEWFREASFGPGLRGLRS